MTPYYEHAGITIYHGDCRDVIEDFGHFGARLFDLLLTDPPYGIGVAKAGRVGSGKRTKSNGFTVLDATDFGTVTWDGDTCADALPKLRALSTHQIIFGGNYYELPPSRCWLVWDKANEGTDFADCELAWTNLDKAVRKLTFRWNGMLQGAGVRKEPRLHPTMKPEPVIRWALMQAPLDVRTVFDPFMGSGTTLVACKRLGRQCVGIEREERYCEIAAHRLSQQALDLDYDVPVENKTGASGVLEGLAGQEPPDQAKGVLGV